MFTQRRKSRKVRACPGKRHLMHDVHRATRAKPGPKAGFGDWILVYHSLHRSDYRSDLPVAIIIAESLFYRPECAFVVELQHRVAYGFDLVKRDKLL